jgi:hypothetical protein
VTKLNAAQKAEYLRSVQASSKAGRGLAKRAAKKNMKNIGAPVFSFDEIVRMQVRYCGGFVVVSGDWMNDLVCGWSVLVLVLK